MKKSSAQQQQTQPKGRRLNSTSLSEETAPRKPSEYVFAVVLALGLIAVLQWAGSHYKAPEPISPEPFNLAEARAVTFSPSDFLLALSQSVGTEFPEQTTDSVSDDLLVRASAAVADEDQALLADTMTLLGVNALRDENAESASLYLDEALSIFEDLESELGIAEVELLRAELNIMKRTNARRAAYAYDAMQLARWKVARGQFHDAIEALEYAVNENLQLQRFGAAAAVYQTLYKGYLQHGQLAEAQQAGVEIVKLHASSGRPLRAKAMLETLEANGLDAGTVQQLQLESTSLQLDYEKSVGQMGQARDYRQLYNHFIHAGDPVRAWQFRIKAQRSLSGVSKRAMHRSQTGVLALLYTSNDYIASAERSLKRAKQLFASNDKPALSETSSQLQKQAY